MPEHIIVCMDVMSKLTSLRVSTLQAEISPCVAESSVRSLGTVRILGTVFGAAVIGVANTVTRRSQPRSS